MAFSNDQVVNLTNRFKAFLEERIELRRAKGVQIQGQREELAKKRDAARTVAVQEVLRKLGIKTKVSADDLGESSRWVSRLRKHVPTISISIESAEMELPLTLFPVLKVAELGYTKLDTLKAELCAEIEFLSPLLRTPTLVAFVAYARALWSPISKGEKCSEVVFKRLAEDFIRSKRPVVCKLAA